MSILTYNGVSLPYPTSTQFSQTGVGDELSNTDWCLTKFDITVTCIINVAYLNMLAPSLQIAGGGGARGLSPADIVSVIRTKLLQRRRALSYTFNGRELIPRPQTGNPGTVDAANGPLPQYCNVFELNNTTWMLQYRITANYWENDSVNSQGNPVVTNRPGATVLYNRWSETEELDNCLMTTRTRTGKYVIRSDNVRGVTVDVVRNGLVALAVPNGFLRTSQHFTVDPSGLGLAYTLVDKEQFKMPPPPAYEATGTYTEQFGPTVNWSNRVGTVRVRLKGSKVTLQDDLYNAAARICIDKITSNSSLGIILGHQLGFKGVILSATATCGLYENTVDMSMTARMQGKALRLGGAMAGAKDTFNFTPLSDGDGAGGATTYHPSFPPYGTAALLLQAASYYDPSLGNATIFRVNGLLQTGQQVGTAGAKKEP